MKNKISNELASAVLGVKVTKLRKAHVVNMYCLEHEENEFTGENMININMYELMHKVKEWACDVGYIIESGDMFEKKGGDRTYKASVYERYYTTRKRALMNFGSSSELVSVVRAAEYILRDVEEVK